MGVVTHGMTNTVEFDTWMSMRKRCRCITHRFYGAYGGRGITICKRWNLFVNFLKDMGLRPEKYTLERIDNNGNYEPNNCKWATWTEQARNKRINNKYGVLGVYFKCGKYEARVKVGGKSKYLGRFTELTQAIQARREGELQYWGKQ